MQILINNDVISASGSTILDSIDTQTINLIINLKNAPTGTSPALVFTIADLDPIDMTTVVGNSVSTVSLTSATSTTLSLRNSLSNFIKVSWALSGSSSPQFTGVDVTMCEKDGSLSLSNSATLSNVSASASSVTLLNANPSRAGSSVMNDSSNILYIKLGATASTSSYTVKVLAGGYYETPFNYLGRIDGIWDGTNGAARITELI